MLDFFQFSVVCRVIATELRELRLRVTRERDSTRSTPSAVNRQTAIYFA